MERSDIPLSFPCGMDFREMQPVERGRLCAACDKVVHDLSAMSEPAAKALLGDQGAERICVRYLYDVHGKVAFGASWPEGTKVIPASRLTARLRTRLAQASLLAAPLLIEACGGTDGTRFYDAGSQEADDVGSKDAAASRVSAWPDIPDARVDDGSTDDAGDAGAGDAGARTDAAGDGSSK